MQGPPAFHRRFQARLDAGTREFRGSDAAPDSFTSFKRSATAWDRDAGVARALDRVAHRRARGEKKDTGPCNTRPTGSPVRAGGAPARPDPTPGDERAVIDASPRSFPLRHSERGRAGRARQPPGPRRVGRRCTNLFFESFLSRRRLARTWLLPSNRPTHRARRSLGSVAASADGFGSIPRGVVRFSTAAVAYGSVAAASGRYAGDRLRPANREPTARGMRKWSDHEEGPFVIRD